MHETQQFISITSIASEEVIKLIAQDNKPDIGLRPGVKGGLPIDKAEAKAAELSSQIDKALSAAK